MSYVVIGAEPHNMQHALYHAACLMMRSVPNLTACSMHCKMQRFLCCDRCRASQHATCLSVLWSVLKLNACSVHGCIFTLRLMHRVDRNRRILRIIPAVKTVCTAYIYGFSQQTCIFFLLHLLYFWTKWRACRAARSQLQALACLPGTAAFPATL